MSKKFSVLAVVATPFAVSIACGGDDGGGGIRVPDASMTKQPDAPVQVQCAAQPSYSVTFGSNEQQANAGSNANEAKVAYLANLTRANPIDLIDIELWTGTMEFMTAVATGTFDLSMKQNNNWFTCGACAAVWPQVMVGSDGSLAIDTAYFQNNQYQATTGTMTLTSVNGNITGSLSNVTFKHINLQGSGSASMQVDAPDGCTTSISSLNFTAPIMAGSATFSGKTDDGTPFTMRLGHRYR